MGSLIVNKHNISLGKFMRAGSGMAVSQTISIACVPLLFRLYSPEDFGVWSVAMAVALSLGLVATLRYELAIVVERDHRSATALFWLSIFLGIALSILFGGVFWLFSDTIFGAKNGGRLSLTVAVATWITLLAIAQGLNGWLLRDGAFGVISQIQVCNAIATNGTHLIAGIFGGEGSWLIYGSLIGQFTATGYSLTKVMKSAPGSFWSCRGNILSVAIRHRRFPFFSAPYTLVTLARERAPVIILASILPAAQVGWYSQAFRLVNIPVVLSSSALRPVMFHAAADHGLSAQGSRVGHLLIVITLLGAPWLGVLAYDPMTAFGTLLGAAWRDAGTLASILAVPAFFFALSNWMDRFLDLQGRQDLNLWTELVTTVLSVGILWLGLGLGFSLLEAVMAQAAVLAVCYVGVIAITYRIVGFRSGGLIRTVALSIVLALAFGLMTCVIGTQTTSLLAMLFSAVIAGTFGVLMAARKLRGWV